MKDFKQYLNLNRDKIYSIAAKNTTYNSSHKAVIRKDDDWRTETEWDDLYEKLKERKVN